jgi:aminoglycoside phosphotransferase (APT) family kinase protein
MPIQTTPPQTIAAEKQIVRDVAGLSGNEEVTFNDKGWDSRVYSFGNGTYFFKFPRSEKIQHRYKYEIAAIKFMSGLDVGVAAQKIRWEHPHNAYFGYEGVLGVPISQVVVKLSLKEKARVGTVLGEFLRQFHALELPGARTMTLADEADQIQRWYQNSMSAVTEHLSPSGQQRLHKLVYETWPTKLTVLGSEPALCHGDLHFENILYAPDGTIGVIDFGDVAYYDRSKDFLELEDDATVFDVTLRTYGRSDKPFMEKVALRQAMIRILDLGYFVGKADMAGIERTIAYLKAYL